ncbi:MAG: hypothetical protein ACREEM_31710, partial [Blastocatellia bacterium]
MQAVSTATGNVTDFRFDSDDELSELGGAASRFRHNIAAIALLKRMEAESRGPGALSTEEQQTLARYTGWGDSEVLDRAFPNGAYSWSRPCTELEALLTPEEIKSLLASSLNAHFTALPIIRAVYAALDHYGIAPATDGRVLELESGRSVAFSSFQRSRLRILEPAAGVGHFLGAMPQALRVNSERVAVEIDSLTGRILQRLYPRTRVFIQPFEETPLPENYFDLVASNVPFGAYPVADAGIRESSLKASIHDYFFARSLRLVKPGGVIAFITSRYTLDKQSPKVRRHLASHAELLAAARLPRTAFRANAGTEVVTDVLVMRKRAQALRDVDADWTETGRITLRNEEDDEVVAINNLFIAHLEWMLGRPAIGHGMYGRDEFLLDSDGRDLAASLAKTLIAQLPADGYRRFALSVCNETESLASDREDFLASAGCDDLSERDRACVEELLEIYVAAKEVIRLQLGDVSDEAIQAKQRELSSHYARFTMRFGPINRNVKKPHPHSPVVPFLKALEVPTGKDRYARAPIFTQRTICPVRLQPGHCSPKEALLISLNDAGRVDLDAIVRLCGQPLDAVLAALDGLIFETTDGQYVTAEEYLSGEVRQKLREAERASQFNLAFEKNVVALKAVQPADLGRDEIIVRLGAAWVPETLVSEFVTSLVPSFSGTVRYISALAVWKIEDPSAWARSSVEANQSWGTSRVNAFELIEDILNLRTTTVTDEIVNADGNTRRVVNDNETIAAQAKQLKIKQKFAESPLVAIQ